MDQTEKTPITIQHPEEEEHHENGASKMFRKVKAKAKKFKNSITKQGQSQELDNRDVVGEDDEDDELEPEVISAPVRGGVTGQPESLSHPIEANIPAPEKIIPPGTKDFPVVSSDYTKPIEPVPLQDNLYGHEALSDPAKATDTSDKEDRRRAETRRDESREADHEAMDTHVPLLSATEDVTSTFAPGGGEDEYLDGQRKVNVESPKKLEEDPVAPGGGRDLPIRSHEVDRETESAIGKDSPVSFGGKSGDDLENDFPTRSHEFDTTTESGIDKDSPWRSHEFDLETESGVNKNSPTGFGAESRTRLEEDSPRRIFESDQKTGSEIGRDSPTGFGSDLGVKLGEDFSARNYESDQNKISTAGQDDASIVGLGEDLKNESGMSKDSPTGYGRESETSLGEDFPAKESHGYGEESKLEKTRLEEDSPRRIYESDKKTESEIDKNSPTGFGGELGSKLGEDFPAENHELDLKNESGVSKDSPTGYGGESETSLGEDIPVKKSYGYGEESEERTFPVRSDDVKVETELGRDLPTETHDQYSTELSRPKERDAFEESRDSFEETRDETQEQQPSSYTDQSSSATSTISAKNAVASKLGYTGESPVGDETQMAGTFDEKLTPDKETGSTATTELPISGGVSDLEETKQGEEEKGYLAEKLTPGEEDKALSEKLHLGRGGEEEKQTTTKEEVTVEKIPSEKVAEEKEHGEAVTEDVKGGGMVGIIKGWFGGGATEEVKPKSPHSVEESSSQSLGSTVGTTGFSDSGKSELGETGGGGGVVPVQSRLGN